MPVVTLQVCGLAQETTSLLLSDPRPQVAPILAFLMSTCGLGRGDALKVLAACPQIVCLSVKNLGQKVSDDLLWVMMDVLRPKLATS